MASCNSIHYSYSDFTFWLETFFWAEEYKLPITAMLWWNTYFGAFYLNLM